MRMNSKHTTLVFHRARCWIDRVNASGLRLRLSNDVSPKPREWSFLPDNAIKESSTINPPLSRRYILKGVCIFDFVKPVAIPRQLCTVTAEDP
jgi:hypothetical protein